MSHFHLWEKIKLFPSLIIIYILEVIRLSISVVYKIEHFRRLCKKIELFPSLIRLTSFHHLSVFRWIRNSTGCVQGLLEVRSPAKLSWVLASKCQGGREGGGGGLLRTKTKIPCPAPVRPQSVMASYQLQLLNLFFPCGHCTFCILCFDLILVLFLDRQIFRHIPRSCTPDNDTHQNFARPSERPQVVKCKKDRELFRMGWSKSCSLHRNSKTGRLTWHWPLNVHTVQMAFLVFKLLIDAWRCVALCVPLLVSCECLGGLWNSIGYSGSLIWFDFHYFSVNVLLFSFVVICVCI